MGTPLDLDIKYRSLETSFIVGGCSRVQLHQQLSDTEPASPTPFLIRSFVRVGTFHRLSLFEEGTLPTTDEHQHFTWYGVALF
ncbi:hypothetical protein L210DRAFT_3565802 [Boletus edulis BED1]|uniref:Uncharacterized protein n=1 Tax=Boletus edulis BED1 TaxID=1328754 RepID=A0AAD4BFS6_BOLED|nr:hypothetical protein L210DRAFT_3565802 [Boletus edulis BED1]